jgi:hypothetical protein
MSYDSPEFVYLSKTWVSMARTYATGLVEHMKRCPSAVKAGQAVKTGTPMYLDVGRQTDGRCGEIACALGLRLDPIAALKWTYEPDGGVDFTFNRYRVDCKTSTHPNANKLIWPACKTHNMGKCADVLFMVKLQKFDDGDAEAHIKGWQWGKVFLKQHKVAANTPGLVDGTPYMSDLRPFVDFVSHFFAEG